MINFDGTVARLETSSNGYITGKNHVVALRASYDEVIGDYNRIISQVQQEEGSASVRNILYNIYKDNSEFGSYQPLDIADLQVKESRVREYEKQIVSKAIRNELFEFHNENEFGRSDIPHEATWNESPDPIIITIDFLSLLTSPVGGDMFLDPIGAVYSYNTDRQIDAAIYSATSIGPFVSGGGAKLAKNVVAILPALISRSNRKQVAEQLFRRMFRAADDDIAKLFLKENEELADELLSNPALVSRLEVLEEPAAKRVLDDLIENKKLGTAFKNEPELVDSWKLLHDAGRTGGANPASALTRNVNAIEAIQNLRSHPKLASLKQSGKITDADLASIQGFSGASFEEVTNQITRLLDNHSSSTLNGFESVISTMKRTGGTQADNAKKGMYWVIRDVADDVDNLAGKNLTLEFGVPNARGSTSRIDVFCSNCNVPNLKIEYKSGPGSISSSTMKEQFIERDLFNANSLDEIQWRMDGTDFTADKLKTWLKENKSSITDIIDGNDAAKSSKFKEFFEMSDFDDVITDSHIDDFVDSNYDLIFR